VSGRIEHFILHHYAEVACSHESRTRRLQDSPMLWECDDCGKIFEEDE